MRYKWLYFLLSSLVIIPGLISLIFYGLKPSIDFTGGSLLELRTKNLELKTKINEIKNFLTEKRVEFSSIQPSSSNTFIIRTRPIDKDKKEEILTILDKKFKGVEEVRFETVGPVLGKELIKKTIIGVLIASGLILLYIGFQFKEKMYGVCAVLGMFHDTIIILGSFSLLGYFFGVEVDTLFVTAVLTTLSFSIHDTVVIYNQIRENQKLNPKATLSDSANMAITLTINRSLNNSLTIIFILLALWLLGGETTKWFVFALLIGAISGTYSSSFTSVPLLVWWEEIKKKRNG